MDSRTRQVVKVVSGILVGAAVVIAINGCNSEPTDPGPAEATVIPPAVIASQPDCTSRVPAHKLGFVDGEIILTGTGDKISLALATLENNGQIAGRRPLVTYDDIPIDSDSVFGFLRDNGYVALGYGPSDYESLVSELVTLRCDVSTVDAFSRVDPAQVFVDVNSLTSKSSVAANNPSDVLNDPSDSIAPIGPHPNGTCCSVTDAKNAVSDQVGALNDRYSSTPPAVSHGLVIGVGATAKVEIFDSFPVAVGVTAPFAQVITWAFPSALTLTVIPIETQDIGDSNINRSDHGVFTAGIIHSMEPDSQITIHQVLDNEGEGTLATLLTALDDLVSGNSALSETVIHLGLHLRNNKTVSTQVNNMSLQSILSTADTNGATTVVATGNYHNPSGNTTPMLAADPASLASHSTFSHLIAVGAGSKDSNGALDATNNACYANTLPGGNNRIREFGGFALCSSCTQEPKCRSQYIHHDCRAALYAGTLTTVTCDDALVSLALSNPPSVDSSGEFITGGTGHGYWIGTSFAAAQITGWIAAHPNPGP